MALTIVQIGLLIAIGICGVLIAIGVYGYSYSIGGTVAVIVLTIMIIVGAVFVCNWYNTSVASGIRNYKDYQSEMQNGLNREIIITAEDGREIFYYKGKCDIERGEQSIKFETQDGQRFIINYGIQDTLIVQEITE